MRISHWFNGLTMKNYEKPWLKHQIFGFNMMLIPPWISIKVPSNHWEHHNIIDLLAPYQFANCSFSGGFGNALVQQWMVYIWYLFKKHHQIYMGIENTIGVWYNNVSKKKTVAGCYWSWRCCFPGIKSSAVPIGKKWDVAMGLRIVPSLNLPCTPLF